MIHPCLTGGVKPIAALPALHLHDGQFRSKILLSIEESRELAHGHPMAWRDGVVRSETEFVRIGDWPGSHRSRYGIRTIQHEDLDSSLSGCLQVVALRSLVRVETYAGILDIDHHGIELLELVD